MRDREFMWITLFALAVLTTGCSGCNGGTLAEQVAFTFEYLDPLGPFRVETGAIVTIRYKDDDPGDLASTSLFADIDGDLETTGDQVIIALDRPEGDGAEQSVDWDTTGVPPGAYRIFAMMSDGVFEVTFEAPGVATVTPPNVAPTLVLTGPDQPLTLSRGACVPVSYVDDDPDDVASTSISADGPGGMRAIAAGRPEQDGQVQSLFWNTIGIPEGGPYTISGTTDDGVNAPVSGTAAGSVTLENVAWAKRAGGDPFHSANAVASFTDRSSAVTGTYDTTFGTVTFGPGEPGAVVFDAGTGAYVARYNADGTVAWARRADGGDGVSIGSLPGGACVIAGSFFGSMTLGPGDADETSFAAPASTDRDGFVARYDASGAMVWAHRIGSAGSDSALAVVGMPDGSCIVAGDIRNAVTFGTGEANETTITPAAFGGSFVARYDKDGMLLWARDPGKFSVRGLAGFPNGGYAVLTQGFEIGMFNADGSVAWMRDVTNLRGTAIAGFADGSLVVAGSIDDPAVFGAGEANETTLTPFGDTDTVVARYNADGTLAWARNAGGTSSIGADAVASLPDGSCVVGGSMFGTATFGAGEANETTLVSVPFVFNPNVPSQDAFVARYLADGTLAFAASAGGSADDAVTGVAGFPDCSSVATGFFSGTATFGEGGVRETDLTDPVGPDAKDMFLARYNADGGF